MDQKQYWNQGHKKHMVDTDRKPSDFAEEVNPFIPKESQILELGCGAGADAAYFSEQGHNVVATDFAETAIEHVRYVYGESETLAFDVLDIGEPFPYDDNNFDVVYAHLSLHYFTDIKTKAIFQEIHRVLRDDGVLCFVCKSTQDPLYGKGEELEANMYNLDGHIRHFFSLNYAKECLGQLYVIERTAEASGVLYGKEAAIVSVIARKV